VGFLSPGGYTALRCFHTLSRVPRRIYAVLDRCPRDGGSLQGARLEAFLLVCPCHGERYNLRSGRSLTDPTLSLELLPVVVERGTVRVALPEKMSAGD
jgi:nitrite reductase/ring-hydroxylating ferredoxin subunit